MKGNGILQVIIFPTPILWSVLNIPIDLNFKNNLVLVKKFQPTNIY